MDRIQQVGLISLVLLLIVAAAAFFVGPSQDPTETESTPQAVAFSAGNLAAIKGLPPEQRKLYPTASSFQKPARPHPLRGAASVPTSSNSAVAVDLNAPDSAPTSVSQSAAPKPRTIRVREGDSLQRIAKREMGSSKHWQSIAKANGLRNPYTLNVGQLLTLPELRKTAEPVAPSSAPNTYKVQPGDTPDRIAKKLWGDASLWPKLLAANGIDDPTRLRVDAVLKVPQLP